MKKFLVLGAVLMVVGASVWAMRGQRSLPALKMPAASPSGTATAPSTASSASLSNGTALKDGVYTGPVASAYYGNVQVEVIIRSHKIADVKFLQYPNDNPTSSYINHQAMPYLHQEALQAQSGSVQIISGATLTSQAFIESFDSALRQA